MRYDRYFAASDGLAQTFGVSDATVHTLYFQQGEHVMKSSILIFSLAVAFFANSAVAQYRYIQGDSRIGCQSRDDYDKLTGFVVSKDMEAFKQGVAAGIATSQCVIFPAGAPVILEDAAIFFGMMKVRVRGETTGYWTAIESAQ